MQLVQTGCPYASLGRSDSAGIAGSTGVKLMVTAEAATRTPCGGALETHLDDAWGFWSDLCYLQEIMA